MADYLLGMNAKIYYGDADGELSALTELTNARDVTLNLSTGKADVTTRANSGWRATAATLKECTVEFEMVWKSGDEGFSAVKDAFLAATEIRLAVLTGDKDTAGSEGVLANFTITGFNRTEPLEDAVKVAVTAELSEFDEWVEVAGS